MPRNQSDQSETDETILEFSVRERLSKEQIVELSTSMGGPRQGSRDDLAEKLLAIKGLKVKEVLEKLSVEDLKLIARRFGVPESPKSSTPGGFLAARLSGLSGEKPGLVSRIEGFASRQRPPRPRAAPTGTVSTTAPTEIPEIAGKTPAPSPTPVSAPTPQPPQVRIPEQTSPPFHPGPAPNLVQGSDAGQFDDLCRFLEAYTFTKRWDSEDLYEAELGGAISGHFRNQKVVHQMAVGGTRADLVACGAVIEIKYPKTKQPLQTLVGQVEGYQKLFGNRVVVVLCNGGLRDTQAFTDSAASLSERGAKVFIK